MTTPSQATPAQPSEGQAVAKPRTSLARASALMASGTLVSRLLGFIRSMMLLAAIGQAAGGVSAAFQTANTLPNTVFNLLAAGVFDAVLVPQIVSAFKRKHEGQVYVNRLLTLGGTVLFLVTLISMVAAPLLVMVTAAGYDPEIRALAILFSLLCLPQLFFYGIYNLLGELLNAHGIFGPYMWAPVVNNIVGIAGLALFMLLWGEADQRIEIADFTSAQFWVLGGSATLGVIAQALVLLIPMRRSGVSFRLDFHLRGTSFGSTSKVAGWTFATLGVSQIGVLSTNNIAALADAYARSHDVVITGINAYATAFMIFMVPQSIITVSLATAIFTSMAEAVSENNDRGVAASYTLGVRMITALTLLAAAILIAASVPLMQMVLYSKNDPDIVAGYAWILAALMPGVASTGMVLMSQRVFFAYEDVRPVFLMGIGPTIAQVIVGWGMYFLTGAQWWVVGAALGETVCRLTQGIIAVMWVSKRNSYVDRKSLLSSYGMYVVSAVIATGISFGLLTVVGVHTVIASAPLRFLVASMKVVGVGIVASLVYFLVIRLVSPRESARTIMPVLTRLRIPAPIRSILAVPIQQMPTMAGIIAPTHSDKTEDPMDRDETLNSDTPPDDAHPVDANDAASAEPSVLSDPVDSVDPVSEGVSSGEISEDSDSIERGFMSDLASVEAESSSVHSAPSFDDVFVDDEEQDAEDSIPSPSQPSPADRVVGWVTSAGASISTWVAQKKQSLLSHSSEGAVSDAVAAGASDDVRHDEADALMPSASDVDMVSASTDDTVTDPVGDSSEHAFEDALVESDDSADEESPQVRLVTIDEAQTAMSSTVVMPAQTGIPSPLEDVVVDNPVEESSSASSVLVPVTNSLASRSDGEEVRDAQGRRLIDPTVPTLIFGAAIFIFGAIWGVSTALAPASHLNLAQSFADSQSGATSQSQSTAAEPEAPLVTAPEILSASVFSWRDDGGDNPDSAVNMIDANPETSWHSRYYDYNVFGDDTNITILVKLRSIATVSQVTLNMDASTTGGEVVVRNVTDQNNPRGGTELVSSALSPTTTLTLPQPVETDAIALSFRTLPTSVDGRDWAWIHEIQVQ